MNLWTKLPAHLCVLLSMPPLLWWQNQNKHIQRKQSCLGWSHSAIAPSDRWISPIKCGTFSRITRQSPGKKTFTGWMWKFCEINPSGITCWLMMLNQLAVSCTVIRYITSCKAETQGTCAECSERELDTALVHPLSERHSESNGDEVAETCGLCLSPYQRRDLWFWWFAGEKPSS